MQVEINHQVYSPNSELGGIAIEDQPKDVDRPSFPPKHDEQRRAPWRMILLASLGGALELYDFVVFGVFASSIGAAFFSMTNPLVSQMLA